MHPEAPQSAPCTQASAGLTCPPSQPAPLPSVLRCPPVTPAKQGLDKGMQFAHNVTTLCMCAREMREYISERKSAASHSVKVTHLVKESHHSFPSASGVRHLGAETMTLEHTELAAQHRPDATRPSSPTEGPPSLTCSLPETTYSGQYLIARPPANGRGQREGKPTFARHLLLAWHGTRCFCAGHRLYLVICSGLLQGSYYIT